MQLVTPRRITVEKEESKDYAVWDCIVEKDLKGINGTTYTHNIHILFGITSKLHSYV